MINSFALSEVMYFEQKSFSFDLASEFNFIASRGSRNAMGYLNLNYQVI